MASSWLFSRLLPGLFPALLPALVVILQLAPARADACHEGAKPFPSSYVGKGKLSYANLFDISYYDTYKVVEFSETLSYYDQNYHPDVELRGQKIPPMVLYQCGTTQPSIGDAGVSTSEVRFFQIPLQKAALSWGGPLPFFELLGVMEAIRTMDLSYISSPCAQLLEECNPQLHVWSSSSNSDSWSAAANANDVVFSTSAGGGWAGREKSIDFLISRDPGTLQRAEWIRFVAAFFNEEVKAEAIFSQIEGDYNELKRVGVRLATDSSTEWGGRSPLVAWVDKRSKLMMSNAYYKRDFVQDGGGRLVPMPSLAPGGCSMDTNRDGSQTLACNTTGEGLASFKSFLAQADVIIDEDYIANHDASVHDFASTYDVTPQEVPALARQPPNVFRLDGLIGDKEGAEEKVGSAWFELMPSQPQQLLAGLMEAMWTDSFESPCGMKFMRRAVPSEAQVVLADSDCPYHDEGGSHDCAAIHDHARESPRCSQQSEVDGAQGRGEQGLGIAPAVAATSALWALVSPA